MCNAIFINCILTYILTLRILAFQQLTQLEVIVVEKLFYRNTLQGNSGTNQKRHECKSILQANRLYTTPHSDTHSMFLELSRFFFNENPDLQLANFLHIITKELNSTEEEIESFICNNLNVPKLPEGEPIWSLIKSPKLSYEDKSSTLHTLRTSPLDKLQRAKPSRKSSAKLNWPPANDKSTTGIHSICETHIWKIPEEKPGIIISAEDSHIPFGDKGSEAFGDERPATPPASGINDLSSSSTTSTDRLPITKNIISDEFLHTSVTELHNQIVLSEFTDRDRLFLNVPEGSQSYQTGRLGELVAYQYFSKKLGQTSVKWVNEKSEMGFPYDLIIEEPLNTRFIEVKATTSATKDWFSMSTNEWHCASEKGESYSIAWVILSGHDEAQINVLDNPFKLCQQKLLQLVLLLPKGS